MINAVTAYGLGKGIGLIIVWFDEMLRRHYNPSSRRLIASELLPLPVIFFDKDFIKNLSLTTH